MKPNQFQIKMEPASNRMWLVHQRYGKPAILLKDVEDEFALCLAAELDRYKDSGQLEVKREMRFDDGSEMELVIRYKGVEDVAVTQ